jgi:hypothetical protein
MHAGLKYTLWLKTKCSHQPVLLAVTAGAAGSDCPPKVKVLSMNRVYFKKARKVQGAIGD